jgi:hypothetical protein
VDFGQIKPEVKVLDSDGGLIRGDYRDKVGVGYDANVS